MHRYQLRSNNFDKDYLLLHYSPQLYGRITSGNLHGTLLKSMMSTVQAHKATDSCDTNPRLLETCSNAPNGSEWFKVGPLSQKQVNMFIPVY